MSKSLTNLSVGISGSFSGLAKAASGALGAVTEMGGGISEAVGKFAEFAGIGMAIEIGMQAVRGVEEAIKAGFDMAEHLEAAQVAFTGLAGSAQNAAAIVDHLKELSIGSGLEFDSLAGASRKLISIGMSADQIEPLLKSLGDVAAGTGGSLENMAELFVKVENEGSVSAKILKKLGAEGVPVMAALEARFGTTAAGVTALAKGGRIGMNDLKAAFESMSGPGGKFAGLMDAQAGTVGGIWRRMKSAITFTAADIILSLEEIFDLKGVMASIMSGVQWVGNALKNGLELARPYLEAARKWIMDSLGGVWETVKPYVMNAWNFIVGAFPGILSVVGDTMGGIWASIQTVWGSIYAFIAPIVTGIYDVIANNWEQIITTAVGFGMAVWNVLESAFTAVFGIAKLVWDDIVAVWNWATELITGQTNDTANANVTAFQSIYDGVSWFVNGLKDLLNAAAYTLQHWQDAADIAGESVILAFVVLGNGLTDFFVNVLPYGCKYAMAVLQDWGQYVGVTIANLGANIVTFVANIPALLTGKISFGDVVKQFSPLTEGMKDHVAELGPLAARIPGELEKALGADLSEKSLKFATGLGEYLNAQDDKAKGAGKKIADSLRAGFGNMKHPKSLGLTHEQKHPEITPTLNPNDLTLGITPEFKAAKLMKYGSGQMSLNSAELVQSIMFPGSKGGAAGGKLPAPNVVVPPGLPAAVAAAVPSHAVPTVPGAAASDSDAPEKTIAADIHWLRTLLTKWDSNPPIAAVAM